ncbi:unnamed protein product [Clavelina lepadiformis]|uniref:non-specific serine/threonine protein kinase n=1 Tax=Clavelina lepadiformis TaxID=159417 RepID=A0ABP0GVN3_CLALP
MIILRNSGGDMRHFRDRNFHSSNHDDDATLWVLIQRVCRREDERARRLQAASQLQEFVLNHDNKQILSRNLESILNSLIDVFFERSGVSLQKDVANVIGLIGQHLSNESYPFFQWLLRQFQSIANDNVRNYLLESLHKLLKLDFEERKFGKVIGMLMDELQAILENIDTPEHLPVCIDPLVLVAQNYPTAFSKHFRDTVDILVGWHIDHTQKMALTRFASESLTKLHTHWLTDLPFSLTLLSQFLEDMEAYAEDFHKLQNGETIEDDTVSAESCLLKMAALMRVFSTVLRSIGPVFHANNGPPITETFILETLQRIIVCAQLAGDGSLEVTRAADECTRLLLGAVQWRGEDMLSESLLTYAVHAVERSRTEARLLLVLDFTTVMVQEVGSALPTWFIQGLLGPSSRLLPLKHSRNPVLSEELLALYQACLSVKSVPLLQMAYKHVAGELQYAVNGLLSIYSKDPDIRLNVITDNPFENSDAEEISPDADKTDIVDVAKEEKLMKTATFDVVALLEVGDARNSLIGMYALSPGIFDLLHDGLKLLHSHLAAVAPSLQFSLLRVLHSHCQRHKNFLSSFLGGSPAPSADSNGGNFIDNVTTATRGHYPCIVELIASLLTKRVTCCDARTLLLHWSLELLEKLKTSKDSSLFSLPPLVDLIQSLVVIGALEDSTQSQLAAKCLRVAVEATSSGQSSSTPFAIYVHSAVTRSCLVKASNLDTEVQKDYTSLLLAVPIDRVMGFNTSEGEKAKRAKQMSTISSKHRVVKNVASYGHEESWLARRSIASKSVITDSTFHAHQFRELMEKLLKHGSSISSHWIGQLYSSCQRRQSYHVRVSAQSHSRSDIAPSAGHDQSFIHWWAVWRAAEFTVTNKLRTSLGRPQDTFQKIEGAIREICEKKIRATSPVTKMKDSSRSTTLMLLSALQRPHLLLQFLDNLEKLLYNAYEGCAVSLPPPTKAVRAFFFTNKQTCEQWFNRLRLAVMRIALSCGLPAVAFQHGQVVLHDMKMKDNTSGFEFESAVAMTVESLIGLKSPQAVEGLYRWCRELGGNKQQWAWMKATKLDASQSYEDAAKEYRQILTSTSRKQSDDDVKTEEIKKVVNPARLLITQQLVRCYSELSSWDNLQDWLKQQASDNAVQSLSPLSSKTDYISALSSFEDNDLEAASEKSLKVLTEFTQKPIHLPFNGAVGLNNITSLTWPDLLRLSKAQTICSLQMAKCGKLPNEKLTSVVETIQQHTHRSINQCFRLSSSYWPPSMNPDFFLEFAAESATKRWLENKEDSFSFPLSGELKSSEWMLGSSSSYLLALLENGADSEDTKMSGNISDLRLGMIRANRKHNNLLRSRDLLLKEVSNVVKEPFDRASADLLTICRSLPGSQMPLTLRLQYEAGKLLYATGHASDSITLLSGSLASYLEGRAKGCGELCARGMLTLVKYLQLDWKNTGPALKDILKLDGSEEGNDLMKKMKILLHIESRSPLAFVNDTRLIAEVNHEIIIGSLLNLATIQAPDMAKAWFTMAGWSYKWGRKLIDQASSAGNVELTNEEKLEVQDILAPLGVTGEQMEDVYGILRKAHCGSANIQVEGDAVDDITITQRGQQNYADIGEAVMEQLNTRCGSWLSHMPGHVSHALLTVWQHVCGRLFTHYRLAAEAYFKFLSLNAGEQATLKYEDCDVTATLRLLRLLVKHALELQTTLKKGFASTPTAPWKGIIPQLFSRLNHPESYVRQSIVDLLCRVALQSSHLIVYPVVVATMQSDPRANSGLGISLEEQEDIEEEAENEKNKQEELSAPEEMGATNSCNQQVIQTLMEEDQSMVRDVQLLVTELRRITLLWDELWLGTLNQHQHDIVKRLQQLQDEAKRVNGNNTLSNPEKENILREQQQAIMRPVVYALGRVQRITSANPETPHERWFADNLQPLIEQALEQLRKPPNPHDPNSCWSGFKQVHSLLQNRASKRAAHILNLGEISPRLMALKSTSMSIPGVTDTVNPVTIEGCSSAVTILPTKTKPKKLQFIGSDGRRYTYLFKGLEDLHLDERIMQFLSIANRLLHRQHESRGYVARHYSVTPLGSRSGLIQWVSGATPLFLLYKRWQQRQAINQLNKQAVASGNSGGGQTTQNIHIMRPSDLYYSKLNPAMKKAGIDIERLSRKDWPTDVLRSVLNELLTETPDDLLQRELWCSATGATEYWDLQQKYSQSTAVMSMIGYVIGLGDRHLDNVLVDLESGEVVHIDYNVCFEKGLQLRVPERVPFRLTQNLLRALGLTGVEGIFRNSCEQVLSTLRKGRETLLTLLEAFVYDPLVDWTGTVEGGYAGAVYGGRAQQASTKVEEEDKLSKKDMEREITRSLFSSRVAEMKQGWFNNRDEMLKALPVLVDKLIDYKTHFKKNIDMNDSIEEYLEVKAKVKSALNDTRHPLNNLPQRWYQHQQQQKKQEATLNTLQDKIQVCEGNLKRYGALLSVLQGPELAALLAEVTSSVDLGTCAFEHASSFLHSAGQANMVSQAQMTEKEIVTVNGQRRHAMQSCLDALSQYAAISAHFPPQGSLRCHSDALWSKRLEQMVDGLLHLDCAPARAEIERSRSKESVLAQRRTASVQDSALQREVNDLNNELMKLIERRNREPVAVGRMPDAERMVSQARDQIIVFVQEHGLEGLGAFTGVLTMLLCAHGHSAIAMETTATSAGHRLVDMASKEGDWFLEELCGLFANMVQLLHIGDTLLNGVISSDPTPPNLIRDVTRAVICADNVYRALLELFNNFRNIIVPEAVKLLQCEEPSVMELASAVNGIVQGVRLDDLTKQLMGCLRSQGMQNGMAASYEEVLIEVQILQGKYDQLLQDSRQKRTDEQRLTAGQMLLQAFDGLFRSVLTDFNALLASRDRLYATGCVPHEWTYVDVISQPLQLQKFKKLSDATDTLQALLFIKQLQAMHDFFALCQSNARAFVVDRLPSSGKNALSGHHYMANLYTEERLAKPVKHFISHFVQELLIGIPSEMLGCAMCSLVQLLGVDLASFASSSSPVQITEDLCKAAMDTKYSQNFIAKPTMLAYHFNRAWKEFDRAQRLDANIVAVRSSLQRAQLQVTRFQWLHEDLLETAGMNFARPRRCDVINDLNKRMATMRHLEEVMQQVQEKASGQITSVQQRLKWAAGANPSLQTVLSSVESDAKKRSVVLKKETELSIKITEICENAIAFEQSRLPLPSSNNQEMEHLRLLDTCESVCRIINTTPVKIDPQERTAVEVMPPKQGTLTSEWLQKLSEKLHSSVGKFRHQRQQEESKMSLVKSNLRDLVGSVKQLLSSHSRLLSDVKALLKIMAKEEDSETDGDADLGMGSVRKYMERYKELTSSLNDALMDVLQGCDASTMLDPDPLIERLLTIAGMVTGVYEDLVAFANPYLESGSTRNQPTFATALRTGTSLPTPNRTPTLKKPNSLPRLGDVSGSQSAVTPNTPPAVDGSGSVAVATGGSFPSKVAAVVQGSAVAPSPKKKVRDPKTGKAIQERNYFAMSVWRKVKSKLDGKDQESGKRMMVTEQVDHVITEATSLDNLALLYEGWTAWV